MFEELEQTIIQGYKTKDVSLGKEVLTIKSLSNAEVSQVNMICKQKGDLGQTSTEFQIQLILASIVSVNGVQIIDANQKQELLKVLKKAPASVIGVLSEKYSELTQEITEELMPKETSEGKSTSPIE